MLSLMNNWVIIFTDFTFQCVSSNEFPTFSKFLRYITWIFETILSEIGQNDYPVIHEGKHAGLIGIGGLVLARIPEEILKSRAEYFRKITQDRTDAIDRDLMKEQHPDMPINIDRQSRVTFGGSRKK